MLDRRFVRENPDAVRAAVAAKGIDLDVDRLLQLDARVRELQLQVDLGQRDRKAFAKKFAQADESTRPMLREQHHELDRELQASREALSAASAELNHLMLLTPGIPWSGAPVGDDEAANTVVREVGTPPTFDFSPIDHVDFIERRGWAEFERARNVSGGRAYALKGDLVRLERAVMSYALDLLVTRDFMPISVSALVKESALVGTGMFPKGRDETYALPEDDLFLAGTSEVALVGLHSGEILDRSQLPIRYAGVSPCFRREIGSAGRDVRGLLRVHQFEKVEQFIICEADESESASWHQTLMECAEQVLSDLELSYQVVECATGDMGLGKFRMNDINTWFPSLGKYRETHSCSTLHDWQARRANLRYRDENGDIKFVHTLNNTAVATPRLLAAIIENHQTEDGRVNVPQSLRPYLSGRTML